jgi:hypothetical protein
MFSTVKSLSVAAVCLCFGLANHAVAGAISGGYFYDYTSTGNDSSCVAPADLTRDNFSSIPGFGSNSISATDTVAFSICDGATGLLDDGEFTIGAGSDTASGTFSGSYVGQSSNPGTIPNGGGSLDNGALFDGTFTIVSADGDYAGTEGDTGTMEVNTGTTNTAGQVNGYFSFTSTPEPVSMLLGGSGLLLIGLGRKLRKS